MGAIKIVINIPEEIQSLIKERINKEYLLSRWNITIFSLFSQTRFAYEPDYITINFKFKSSPTYYFTHPEFTIAKKILTKIFLDDLTWFEITDNRTDEFWIIIRSIEHQKSWTRIK